MYWAWKYILIFLINIFLIQGCHILFRMMTLSLLTISLILEAMQEICLLLDHIREVIQDSTCIFEVP